MSILDRYFAATATRGLDVVQVPVMGESDLDPGHLYRVEGADGNQIFGIAGTLAEAVGKRLAIKVVTAAPTPPGGLLEIVAPDGMRIENDSGELVEGLASVGEQALGAYREWLCDPDGNWLLVSTDEGGDGDALPFGQIVIKGTPVVIKGTPLVNTSPMAAALASRTPPVTIATIVPRSAPRPLVVSVIELEDTFADASLEMDATGDLFRVALDLQAAIRIPFTLRETGVFGTSFEEIGVLRFDPTVFGADFTLVAELEVSLATQTAELQLYDLTSAAVVATVSTSGVVTTKCTADVTLPLSEVLYSIRLRRVGADATQRASCRSVYLEAR